MKEIGKAGTCPKCGEELCIYKSKQGGRFIKCSDAECKISYPIPRIGVVKYMGILVILGMNNSAKNSIKDRIQASIQGLKRQFQTLIFCVDVSKVSEPRKRLKEIWAEFEQKLKCLLVLYADFQDIIAMVNQIIKFQEKLKENVKETLKEALSNGNQ